MAMSGLVAEFIFTNSTSSTEPTLVLHGFWAVSLANNSLGDPLPGESDGNLKLRTAPVRAYPFPVERQPQISRLNTDATVDANASGSVKTGTKETAAGRVTNQNA